MVKKSVKKLRSHATRDAHPGGVSTGRCLVGFGARAAPRLPTFTRAARRWAEKPLTEGPSGWLCKLLNKNLDAEGRFKAIQNLGDNEKHSR